MGVRERIAYELNARADEVARVLVADAIKTGDASVLRIALDQGLGKPVERHEDVTTDELPPQELVALARQLADRMQLRPVADAA